ncbi:unnamed protein product [Ectocarpus sp. CCAP 1310/34]|nr:unnamed protein product [Ectocarpus sp. CCAP 1310/34]
MTSQGSTPLHKAANETKSEVVGVLIRALANPNSRMVCGAIPLHIVAQFGHENATRELLRGKMNPFLTKTGNSSSGGTAIPMDPPTMGTWAWCATYSSGEVVVSIANAGNQALLFAASEQHLDIVAILTEADVVDRVGLNYLSWAPSKVTLWHASSFSCGNGTTRVHGALNARTSTPATLTAARPWLILLARIQRCCSHAPRIVRLLFRAGADVASAVRVANSNGEQEYSGTPRAVVTSCLREKVLANGAPTTEE